MLKKLLTVSLVTLLIAGCAYLPRNHEPVVPEGVDTENAAYIRTNGVSELVQVGPHKLKGFFSSHGATAAYVREGNHQIRFSYNQNTFRIPRVELVAGHEYFVEYVSNSRKIIYWVTDETTGEVVAGQRATADDL